MPFQKGSAKRSSGNRTLRQDRHGVAALEFVFILPILVIVITGVFDLVQLIRVNMKMTHSASMLAKIVAQSTQSVSPDNLLLLCTAARTMMDPFPSNDYSASIDSVVWYSTGMMAVSTDPNATPIPQPSTGITISQWPQQGCTNSLSDADKNAGRPGVQISGDSSIVVKVTYTYEPVLRLMLKNVYLLPKISLSQLSFAKPRDNTPIYMCSSNCGGTPE